jgi:GTPase SAR1 family protein
MAARKVTMAKAISVIDVTFALLALAEVIYIFRWKCSDEEFSLSEDVEFCSVYILQRRENIGSIIRKIRQNQRGNDKKFFVKLIIQENRFKTRHEIYDTHLDKPLHEIEKIEDIFKSNNSGDRELRKILIVGRPGIGKTALTKQIMQEWKMAETKFGKGQLLIRLEFRMFNHEEKKKLNLSTLFSYGSGVAPTAKGEIFQDLYQFIQMNQEKIIVIFDGLDELNLDLDNCWQEEEKTDNNPDLIMPVFCLYVKLIRGVFLPDITIITTTRRTAEERYQPLNTHFDKQLEILGFTETEIENFVIEYCKPDQEQSSKLCDIIKQSAELLSICYIPVGCKIVCLTLTESVSNQGQETVSLTMTEIYRRYICIVLHEHSSSFKTRRKKKGYLFEGTLPRELEIDVTRLAKIAKSNFDVGKLEFQLGEDCVHLENCGLLVKIKDEFRNRYSFVHLTIQEYLAAMHTVHYSLVHLSTFLTTKINEPRWHLVIQFLAGLIGVEMRKSQEDDRIKYVLYLNNGNVDCISRI